MSARDDGITGEVLDKADPPQLTGPHCGMCGRALCNEPAWVGEWGDLACMPCQEAEELNADF